MGRLTAYNAGVGCTCKAVLQISVACQVQVHMLTVHRLPSCISNTACMSGVAPG